ncbi:MAG: sigma-E processing peptidase SpoIIGA [Oscillospiraceae bacterium]|nr:sigma-E processing peptidase SpoIIGA [Oscillospiraceae bacterium]
MSAIYIDLLVIINLYITYFLLKGTAIFLHLKIRGRRLLLASLAGGISSLIILLPPLPFVVNIAVKATAGMLIVLLAFGYKSGYEYSKNSLIFITINVVFAGFTMMLWLFAAPLGMEFNNGIPYFDISFMTLVITTALAYGLIRILRYILDVKHAADRKYTITVTIGGKSVTLDAIADSGNMLTDYFTGLPVIVCPGSGIDIPDLLPRFLPYNTIDSTGLIPVFRAEEIVIITDNVPNKSVNALIGISDSPISKDSPAVFNPKLLI